MGTRFFLVLIFFLYSAGAFACSSCHKPHYQSVGSCAVCHRGSADSSRENIAHSGLITSAYASFMTDVKSLNRGKSIADEAGCRRCHTLCGTGGKAAANLDVSAMRNTGEYLDGMIKKPNSYMPYFGLNDADRRHLVRYVLRCGTDGKVIKDEPYVAYITPSVRGVFEKNCGPCHRMLTRKGGGRGTGTSGPNLSGLFGKYFRSSVLAKGKSWDEKTLVRWLTNPRQIKKDAIMPPQTLNTADTKKLIKEMKQE